MESLYNQTAQGIQIVVEKNHLSGVRNERITDWGGELTYIVGERELRVLENFLP